jgi:hypothetical protein
VSLRSRVRAVLRQQPITTHERVVFVLVNELRCDPKDVVPKQTLDALYFDARDLSDLRAAMGNEFGIDDPDEAFPVNAQTTIADLVRMAQ